MTDAHVRSLLPGSFFGLADDIFDHGLWGVAHEHALHHQQFATSPDFLQFQQEQVRVFQAPVAPNQLGPFDAELRLWEVLQHRFRCGLDDFFRYGLRPSLPRDHAGFSNYCVKLTAILVHPMWLPDIAHVRWILQRVVQERVPGHVRPLVPVYSYDRPPFADTAREWGFDVSMRMSLTESESSSSSTTKSTGDNPLLSRLASASRDASRAATEAEAELAWFFFSANAPRDLWWLDWQLQPVGEPGRPDVGAKTDDDEEEEDGDGEDENPFGLRVCDEILYGTFGQVGDSDNGDENVAVETLGDRRRREDNNAHQVGKHGGDDNDTTGAVELRPDQIFFHLQDEDLDRVLRLLAHPAFMEHTGFIPPQHYYAGYIKAHNLYGYGDVTKKEEGEEKPLLTCLQCAKKYHQGDNSNDHDHDHDREHDHGQDHDDGEDKEEEDNTASSDEHGHYLFQQFVRDVDSNRALEWLLHRKCEWLLAGCREGLIRASLEVTGDDLVLPDIPPFDPPPLAAQDRVFTHPSQLAVLERIEDVPHASVLWCLGQGEGGVDSE
ncbi:hypothetical protein Sste5346_009530 [Sporothrix stenoceras]|uniref:C2H2-type domain-containing protein n=1 Tax=Sporothrix stenoceras TaxID=5173 RepID=A0ABR3YJK2_9PEZI